MADDIPFNRVFDLEPGRPQQVVPGVRRVLANNPSPFTFKGTVSYIIGEGEVAILDPGPDDERHAQALLDAVRGETVTHIFVTHTHRDHSPNAARIKAATGAPVYAEGPHRLARELFAGEALPLDGGADLAFRPDVSLADGAVVRGAGWTMQAVATPGHTSNHLSYALPESACLFSGDHVMGWSTSIVAPPDGSMTDYMASLDKLAARPEQLYLPGHGPEIRDAVDFVHAYIRHRRARETAILDQLARGLSQIEPLVRAIYIGLDERLVKAAGLSVLAHLEALVEAGRVATDGPPSLKGSYRLT